MAVVPYRVTGPAADQSLPTRLIQLGGHAINIEQDQRGSGSLAPLVQGEPVVGFSSRKLHVSATFAVAAEALLGSIWYLKSRQPGSTAIVTSIIC